MRARTLIVIPCALVGVALSYIIPRWHDTSARQPTTIVAASNTTPVDPHLLALEFVERLRAKQNSFSATTGPWHKASVAEMRRVGLTEANAIVIIDSYLLPALRTRTPLLQEQLAYACEANFTQDEMRSVIEDRHDDARRSVASKFKELPKWWIDTELKWGNGVIQDVLRDNATTFAKMTVSAPAARR